MHGKMARNNGIDNVGSIIGCVNEGKSGNSYLGKIRTNNLQKIASLYLPETINKPRGDNANSCRANFRLLVTVLDNAHCLVTLMSATIRLFTTVLRYR